MWDKEGNYRADCLGGSSVAETCASVHSLASRFQGHLLGPLGPHGPPNAFRGATSFNRLNILGKECE